MSIFEIIGELFNPGPIGSLDFKGAEEESSIRRKFIPVRFVIALALILLLEYFFLFRDGSYRDLGQVLRFNGFLLLYLLIAYITRIRPDHDNLGWVPFIINNPFRISDNFNRLLVVLSVLFLPGRYIVRSILDFYRYSKE